MPKYVIERDIPAVGNLSSQELHDGSKKSCDALRKLGPQIQWVQSYVTETCRAQWVSRASHLPYPNGHRPDNG
jgi:hypothetical protein